MVRRASGEDEDPTKAWYAEIANVVQNALTNSPLNEGKKAFVKMLAGNYDEAATKARLLSLIQEKPVLMPSFTTPDISGFCVKAKALLDGALEERQQQTGAFVLLGIPKILQVVRGLE